MKKYIEKAILVGAIHRPAIEQDIIEQLDELSLLARTAGAEVIGSVTQKLDNINPAYFIGKGKAEQLIHQAQELKAD